MSLTDLNEKTFNKNISKGVVVVDFYSTHCPPCAKLKPIIEQIQKDLSGQVSFFGVNIDKSENLASQFGVEVVPTLMIFKDGKIENTVLGLLPKGKILDKIKSILNS